VGLGSKESQRNWIFGAKNGARAKKFENLVPIMQLFAPKPHGNACYATTFNEATSGEVVHHFLIDSEDFERLDICLQKELSLFSYSISIPKVLEQN